MVNHAEKNLIYFNNAGTEEIRERKEGNIIGNPIEPVIKLSASIREEITLQKTITFSGGKYEEASGRD